ncbi:TrkA family potassium uptake protein [Bacillus sp. AFS017336]|uniref:potassium channel family protein n=1 Tax=Bacillus sp. AFS017336 TaxID=2033489 RepID=UPI000BEFDC17|nr:TrkA family potassium uptake protein [Bacillus sp. AFS017336]PEL13852.1 potassium transporter Trk [Bacillus sp. AFS017336]
MKKQFAVFGLGRFGGSLVKAFSELGVDVLAVDLDLEKVNDYTEYATHVVQANGIDELTLKTLGIRNFDHVFVSFGNNIEGSILTSLLLKELGIPQVWAKAQNDYHQRVLEKIGVDRVIHPERDMAKRIARHIVTDKMVDYFELSKNHSIVEIRATEKIHNKTLVELDVRAKYGCNIVGFQRNDEMIVSSLRDYKIHKDDILIVIGHNDDIRRFEEEGV